MRIFSTDRSLLIGLAREAAELICSGDFETLVFRFGYARAFERKLVQTFSADLQSCLKDMGAHALVKYSEPTVTYLNSNASALLAAVETRLTAENGRSVLVELVAAGSDDEMHLSLEDVNTLP